MGGGRTSFEITVIPSILLQIAFDFFNEIRDFRLGHEVYSPNTEQNLPTLPFHRSKNC